MKTRKAVLRLLLVCFTGVPLFVFPQTFGSGISSQALVKVDPNTNSAGLNETFTVNITVADVQNLYGLAISLHWNKNVLEPASIDVRVGQTDGALSSSAYNVENSTSPGEYSFAATSVAPALAFNGTGVIVRITFHVKNRGSSPLDLTSQLYDFPPPDREPRISLPIEHVSSGGLFEEIIPEITNFPLFALLISFAISATVFSLKKLRKPQSANAPAKVINHRMGLTA
jgi:hypothetical protein